jgi:hypothetical protein
MVDKFRKAFSTIDGPSSDGFAITPGANLFAQSTRAIYVGGGGNITLLTVGNTVLTFTSVGTGTIIPIRATAVYANSTATSMVGMF